MYIAAGGAYEAFPVIVLRNAYFDTVATEGTKFHSLLFSVFPG